MSPLLQSQQKVATKSVHIFFLGHTCQSYKANFLHRFWYMNSITRYRTDTAVSCL